MSVTNTGVTPQVSGTPAPLEPCGRRDHPDCGIREVLDRLGDRWSVLVIVELASGPRRFRELERAIAGVSQRMLTLTLRRLERDGLVRRTVYPTVPAQVDYRLTAMGASLTHLVKALADWSAANRESIAEARAAYDARTPDPPERPGDTPAPWPDPERHFATNASLRGKNDTPRCRLSREVTPKSQNDAVPGGAVVLLPTALTPLAGQDVSSQRKVAAT